MKIKILAKTQRTQRKKEECFFENNLLIVPPESFRDIWEQKGVTRSKSSLFSMLAPFNNAIPNDELSFLRLLFYRACHIKKLVT